MRAVPFIGGVIRLARTVGDRAGPDASADEQRSPHGLPRIVVGRCSHYCSAMLPLVVTTRRTLAACGVARYSES